MVHLWSIFLRSQVCPSHSRIDAFCQGGELVLHDRAGKAGSLGEQKSQRSKIGPRFLMFKSDSPDKKITCQLSTSQTSATKHMSARHESHSHSRPHPSRGRLHGRPAPMRCWGLSKSNWLHGSSAPMTPAVWSASSGVPFRSPSCSPHPSAPAGSPLKCDCNVQTDELMPNNLNTSTTTLEPCEKTSNGLPPRRRLAMRRMSMAKARREGLADLKRPPKGPGPALVCLFSWTW